MKRIFLLSFLVLPIACLYGQEKTVLGKITVFDEIPVQNVLIVVKSNKQESYSDTLGNFSVSCAQKDKITFSAEGFSKRKIKIKKEIKYALVNLILLQKEGAKDIAIGYGHIKDKEKLYAMASQDESSFDFSRYQNIYDVIEGNFPGVQVINGEIIIRNSNSFSSSNAALLIIDGREVDKSTFANITTIDIARINILKDASAAIYGVRGGNGAVIVETKRGK